MYSARIAAWVPEAQARKIDVCAAYSSALFGFVKQKDQAVSAPYQHPPASTPYQPRSPRHSLIHPRLTVDAMILADQS